MSQFDAEFAKIRENTRKLNACKRHRIEPGSYQFGKKVTCLECGGNIDGPSLAYYVRGYEAAGGNADDIWPNFNGPKAGDEK